SFSSPDSLLQNVNDLCGNAYRRMAPGARLTRRLCSHGESTERGREHDSRSPAPQSLRSEAACAWPRSASTPIASSRRTSRSEIEGAERLLEPTRVRLLGLRQRLEPLGDVVEAFLARSLREARVHRLVLVRLAGDGALQVLLGVSDREARGRITDALQVVEVA